jgi:hypothetical protein
MVLTSFVCKLHNCKNNGTTAKAMAQLQKQWHNSENVRRNHTTKWHNCENKGTTAKTKAQLQKQRHNCKK